MTFTIARPFRIIRGEPANYKTIDYKTKEARDKGAERWAQVDLAPVLCEVYDTYGPQDDLTPGWALDRVVMPRTKCGNCFHQIHMVNVPVGNGIHEDVWVHLNNQRRECDQAPHRKTGATAEPRRR